MSKARLLFEDKQFRLLKGRDYIVVRKDFPYEFHSHFQNRDGAMLLISLFYKRMKPLDDYFIVAMERITTESERGNFGVHKAKPMFFNVNKKGAKKHRGR